jgi:hypothetical protein
MKLTIMLVSITSFFIKIYVKLLMMGGLGDLFW